MADYQPTIGIECHVQLKTKTKLFAAVGNDARGAPPNTLISHICVGMPGALPVLNRAAIELAAKAAFALNTKPQKISGFERKHYFYPDLPKGYQITQYERPIIADGSVEIMVSGKPKTINITRAHLEEDAGKNTHPGGADYTLVDLNRAGTPLLEIVSEPDIKSAVEAKAYARELWLLMKYAGVTDGDLYHGHMRFDVNVSVSRDPNKLGTRSETKNLNSFRSVEAAVEYEIKRQIELLEKGEQIVQETRGWDDAKQKTISQRSKEEAEDYRYMPEPDIPPIELDDKFIDNAEKAMPKLPVEIRESLKELSLDPEVAESILDWPDIMPTIFEILEKGGSKAARNAIFWILHSQLVNIDTKNGTISESNIDWRKVKQLSDMRDANSISSNSAQTIFQEMSKTDETPEAIANRLNLLQVSDEREIEKIVAEVLGENAQAAEDVKNGEMKAIGFLVGQVMAKSKGQANPQMAQQLIKKQLGI